VWNSLLQYLLPLLVGMTLLCSLCYNYTVYGSYSTNSPNKNVIHTMPASRIDAHPKLRLQQHPPRHGQPRAHFAGRTGNRWGTEKKSQDYRRHIESDSPPTQNHTSSDLTRKSIKNIRLHQNEWFKESIDGLSCDHDRQLCDNEDECAHLSYLWHMAQLYSSFHSRGVQLIKDGRSDSVRTLTWYCGSTYDCGGLGNQFQGMTVTWVLGMFTGRVMLLKWKDESAVSKYLLPHMVDWRYHNYQLNGSYIDLGSYREHFHNVKELLMYHPEMMAVLMGSTQHVQVRYNLLRRINQLIYGTKLGSNHLNQLIFNDSLSNHFKLPFGRIPGIKLPSYGKFHIVLTEFVAIHMLFKLSDQLKSHFYNVQSQITSATKGGQYVAVHLRTGSFDDLYEPKVHNRNAHIKDYYSKAIKCAVKQANKRIGPGSLILLVSDSTEAKHLLSKEYPRVRIFENKIVHVDMHSNVTEDGMLGVWQDIAILAKSNVLIKHVSTFSDLAAVICGIPHDRIVDFAKC